MPGATYVLDKTYKLTEALGVGKFLAVMEYASDGSADGVCKLPTGANVHAVGITQEAQAKTNENVAVRVLGISRAKANGVIHAGDPVRIAAATGYLESATLNTTGANVNYVVGWAVSSATTQGDIFFVFLAPFASEGAA